MFQQPTYAQPFTMEEALQLDVLIISEEISRLRHSIQLLRESNAQILAFLDEEGDDQELRESVEENLITIGSQKERIAMLQAALAAKIGARSSPADAHYALAGSSTLSAPSSEVVPSAPPPTRSAATAATVNGDVHHPPTVPPEAMDEDDGGVYL